MTTMANDTDSFTIDMINRVSFELNRYITLFVFLFGTLGNLLNVIVLIQPKLRSTPSVIYFMGSSISGIGIMLIGLPSRIIAGWVSTDPTNTNSMLCRCRIFLLYSFRTTSVWLIVLATFDRWLSSSSWVARRRLSSPKIAYKGILIVNFLSFILWIESAFCYDTNVAEAPIRCYGKTHACRIFNDVVYATSTVLIPSFLMLVLGLLTIRHFSRSRRTVAPTNLAIIQVTRHNRPKPMTTRRRQISLTRMLLFQVILLTIFSLPQALHQLYFTFAVQLEKSPLRRAVESFIVNLNFSLTYIGNGIPFYIYTLSAPLFRRTLIRLLFSIRPCPFRCLSSCL